MVYVRRSFCTKHLGCLIGRAPCFRAGAGASGRGITSAAPNAHDEGLSPWRVAEGTGVGALWKAGRPRAYAVHRLRYHQALAHEVVPGNVAVEGPGSWIVRLHPAHVATSGALYTTITGSPPPHHGLKTRSQTRGIEYLATSGASYKLAAHAVISGAQYTLSNKRHQDTRCHFPSIVQLAKSRAQYTWGPGESCTLPRDGCCTIRHVSLAVHLATSGRGDGRSRLNKQGARSRGFPERLHHW